MIGCPCDHLFVIGCPVSPGVPPKDSSFLINALLLHHYKRGAYYPRGGASEFAFNIIPVIRKAGGAVLVRAPVQRVLVDQLGSAYGQYREEALVFGLPEGNLGVLAWGSNTNPPVRKVTTSSFITILHLFLLYVSIFSLSSFIHLFTAACPVTSHLSG